MKLLVLADDLTGALDTGIQFVAGHANTRIILSGRYPLTEVDRSVQVLVIDTESRHLPPAKAAEIVRDIVCQAVDLEVPYIYKKTDSALRGNAGAELSALLEASGANQLQFIPAFPRTGRTTVNGVQLIDGVPVAQSVFGRDPFNPVRHSAIGDILTEQADVAVHSVRAESPVSSEKGIVVYDARTDDEIGARARQLKESGRLHILAGCAGFAAVLPELMELGGADVIEPEYGSSFFVACGSVNPITVAQLAEAEHHGFTHIHITPAQALGSGYFRSDEGRVLLDSWAGILNGGANCILDTNPAPGAETAYAYAQRGGISLEELRVRIADTMGLVVQELLRRNVHSTMLITGGDTLMAFMRTVGVSEISPVCELAPGSVLSMVQIGREAYPIISKSGGFGEKTLMVDLAKRVLGQK